MISMFALDLDSSAGVCLDKPPILPKLQGPRRCDWLLVAGLALLVTKST